MTCSWLDFKLSLKSVKWLVTVSKHVEEMEAVHSSPLKTISQVWPLAVIVQKFESVEKIEDRQYRFEGNNATAPV